VLILTLIELAKSRTDDHQIGGFKSLETRQALLVVRIDIALFRVGGKKHGAIKSMTLAQQLGQHGAAFLRAIFFITADKNDFFSIAWARLPFEG